MLQPMADGRTELVLDLLAQGHPSSCRSGVAPVAGSSFRSDGIVGHEVLDGEDPTVTYRIVEPGPRATRAVKSPRTG